MNQHKYILQPYKGMNSRHHCPQCQHRDKTFALYINTETGESLADHVGRCNREDKCSYHYTPKQFFVDNDVSSDSNPVSRFPSFHALRERKQGNVEMKPVSFTSFDIFKQSLSNYEQNNFIAFLRKLFGTAVTKELIAKYFIGTSSHWDGATIFWQIDTNGKIRAGKIMLYDGQSGKRIKEPFNHITWVHRALKRDDYNLQQSFFGSHLLKDKSKLVAICESEKTSLIASIYLPQFIWLACGSKEGLNEQKCQALAGRQLVLYPDLNAYDAWCEKAKKLSHIASFKVSDLLERKATTDDKEQGLDIADYLIRFDYKEFHQVKPNQAQNQRELNGVAILIENIISIPCETVTPAAFGGLRMLTVKTPNGNYDLLLGADGEPLTERTEQAKALEEYFNKQFLQAKIEGFDCLAHIIK